MMLSSGGFRCPIVPPGLLVSPARLPDVFTGGGTESGKAARGAGIEVLSTVRFAASVFTLSETRALSTARGASRSAHAVIKANAVIAPAILIIRKAPL